MRYLIYPENHGGVNIYIENQGEIDGVHLSPYFKEVSIYDIRTPVRAK